MFVIKSFPFHLDFLFWQWPTCFNNVAISSAIDSTICPDKYVSIGPFRFDPDAVRFPSVVPIKLHKKLAVREDVASPSSGFTWVDLAFRNVMLNIQNVSEPSLSFVREVEAHLRCSDIPKDDGGE